MKKTLLAFVICLSVSRIALGQYVFSIADLQMLSNGKTPAFVKTYVQAKGYTFLGKEVENGTIFYTYAIPGQGGRNYVLDVSFSKLQKSFEVTFVFDPETILKTLVREAENQKIFDRMLVTDDTASYADKNFKWIILIKEQIDNGNGTTAPVKVFSCHVRLADTVPSNDIRN